MEDVVVLCLGPLHHFTNHMVRNKNLPKKKKEKEKRTSQAFPLEMRVVRRRDLRGLTCNVSTRDHIVVVKNSSSLLSELEVFLRKEYFFL